MQRKPPGLCPGSRAGRRRETGRLRARGGPGQSVRGRSWVGGRGRFCSAQGPDARGLPRRTLQRARKSRGGACGSKSHVARASGGRRQGLGSAHPLLRSRLPPGLQEYFPHFDLCPGSKDIRHHGQKVVKALDSALKHLDNLHDTLADLSDLHAYNLRVDPVNFKLLAKCFHVTLASQLRAEYNPLVYLAWDKFFHQVACCLSEKYR
uniref:Globin domain-containing protein n=1 Tax=Salvator merianae TaxID=96440 RepID=A0A8D0BBA8_SALMN